MAGSTSHNVKELLVELRSTPVDTAGASDTILAPIYTYLMGTPPTSSGELHWFCTKAESTTAEAAVFLLRLFAYNSPQVTTWKEVLNRCLNNCTSCIQSFEEAKLSSRGTYFGAFNAATLAGFYENFENWELAMVLQKLSEAGFTAQLSTSDVKSISNVSSEMLYRMFSNWTIFCDNRIQSIIHKYPPREVPSTWLSGLVPPGVLLLSVSNNPDLRSWAQRQISHCSSTPMKFQQFTLSHRAALNQFSMALNGCSNPALRLIAGSSELWIGLRSVLKLVPSEVLKPAPVQQLESSPKSSDMCQLVVKHLCDHGSEFGEILKCFQFLLKRFGGDFWKRKDGDNPQTVFDIVKDNPSFTDLILDGDGYQGRLWYTWLTEFLHTTTKLDVYEKVFTKVIDFLCGQLQYERVNAIESAADIIISAFKRSHDNSKTSQKGVVKKALDKNTDTLFNVAFRTGYEGTKWKQARIAVRSLISIVLRADLDDISAAIMRMRDILAETRMKTNGSSVTMKEHRAIEPLLPLCINKQMWEKLYSSLKPEDIEGLSSALSLASRIAHIDKLKTRAFQEILVLNNPGGGYESVGDAIEDINNALTTVRNGINAAVVKLNTSTSCLNMLQLPNVGNEMMILLLSPVEDLQSSAQALVEMAFDVDARSDCFRALFENVPDAALDGMLQFLTTFLSYAKKMPEACSVSKSLVRCLTDIIEVLCSSPNGLLHNAKFLQASNPTGPASRLLELWSLMTQSLSAIFKRTPSWAEYFENQEMTDWMRDALIFGRDMLAQRKVIETAASSCHAVSSGVPSGKLSPVGKQMIEDLQDVLYDMLQWLRLTDEELLHQSFALLESFLELFRDAHIHPTDKTVNKLERIVNARRNTRLDPSRVLRLESALSSFTADDDSIHLIPEPTDPKVKKPGSIPKTKPEPVGRKQTKDETRSDQMRHSIAQAASKYSNQKVKGDQQNLDDIVSIPSFRKATNTKPSVSGDGRLRQVGKGPKNEALARKAIDLPSSDSDSDDEPGEGGLAALTKLEKSVAIKRQEPRRQIKTIDLPVQSNAIRNRIDEREERRREMARMKPNISGLHRTILSWNYNHDGSMPPDSNIQPQPVPDTFKDYNQYFKVFEPLLLAECWAQLLQAKEEKAENYDCKISSRQYSDTWIDLDISIINSVQRDWYLAETDVVLLSHPVNKKCILGKTQSYRATPHVIQATIRCFIHSNAVDPGLQINSVWKLNKVFSLSTLHREYGALVSLQYYDFCDSILRPQLPYASKKDQKELQRLMITYKVNEPQAAAILNSLETKGFALIQGPPGTGKTSTICALVGLFMETRSRPAVPIQAGKMSEKAPTKKVLICAPSNAAIDEIASRIKDGYKGSEKVSNPLKVVRIGTEKSMNVSVKDISLDYLVDQKLDSTEKSSKDVTNEILTLRRELESVKSLRQQKIEEKTALIDNSARASGLDIEIQQLNARRMALNQQLDRMRDKQKSDSRTVDALRRKTRKDVLKEADVICATLSGAGHEILEDLDFEMIVIDEAAQAIELSSLIPLKYRCVRCVMVGDPQQLPPTVISQEASKYRYNQSLFVRLQKQRPDAVHLLSIQYRMHPDISALPSRIFYRGRLLDGPGMEEKTAQPWQHHPKFGTYKFFNIRGVEEQAARSLKNIAECQVAIALYRRLRQDFSSANLDFCVGVVSMYKAQVNELRRQFTVQLGADIAGRIDFNTVDGFQGQEKSIIILSCVRAGPGLTTVGFLSDIRRMNVALTRAKSSLYILGNASTLERSDENWRNIVLDARSRSALVEVNDSYFTAPVSYVPPKSQKKAATKTVSTIPIPDDLITPREFKTKMSINEPEVPAPPIPSNPLTAPEDIKMESPPRDISTNTTEVQPRGVKRPVDSENPVPPTPQIEDAVTTQPARPVKRAKQPTLFIPRKHIGGVHPPNRRNV